MTNTPQTLITVAAVLAAVFALFGYYNKAHNWYLKQERQDKDIKSIKADNTMLTYGVLACLKGLHEQGCDGPVDEAIAKFEKYLNQKAHDQLG